MSMNARLTSIIAMTTRPARTQLDHIPAPVILDFLATESRAPISMNARLTPMIAIQVQFALIRLDHIPAPVTPDTAATELPRVTKLTSA